MASGSGNSVYGPARAPVFDGTKIRPDRVRYVYLRPPPTQQIKIITDSDLAGDIYVVQPGDAYRLIVENCSLTAGDPGIVFSFPLDLGWDVGTTVDIMRTGQSIVALAGDEGTEIITPYGTTRLTSKWAPSRCTVQLMWDTGQDTPYWRSEDPPSSLSWYAFGDMRPNSYGEIVFSYAGVLDTLETSAPWLAPFDLSVFEVVVAALVDGAADIDFLVEPIGQHAALSSGSNDEATAVTFASGAISAGTAVTVELDDIGSSDVEDVTVTVRYYPSMQSGL